MTSPASIFSTLARTSRADDTLPVYDIWVCGKCGDTADATIAGQTDDWLFSLKGTTCPKCSGTELIERMNPDVEFTEVEDVTHKPLRRS